MNLKQTFKVQPQGSLQGSIRVPGDKSISHRAIMMGAIAEGTTQVKGFLEGEDSLATLKAFRAMGVTISEPLNGSLRIEGAGLRGLQAPQQPLDMGNSGTAMRLLCGLLAAQNFSSTLVGDESLSTRPMKRVTEPLKAMGAQLELEEGGVAPIKISPAQLTAINYSMPVASAQVKSCLMLASLYVDGKTIISEPAPCRNHTELMLQGFGYPIAIIGNRVEIEGGAKLKACDIDIPADISSAAFFLVGACIAPGSDLILEHVGINPTRIGVINILRAMGANIEYLREYNAGGEVVADIRVRYAPLHGIDIPVDQVPLAIDEFPVLFIAAACAEGDTILSGAEELKVKESDRIQAMADGMATLGVLHEVKPDGIIITGSGGSLMTGGEVDSKGDHRIAMAFTIAALVAKEPISILDCNNVATSFPGFAELAQSCGIDMQVNES
jgi:3-phosphoshikimate 1-carboxyvinyltransferase